MLALLVDGVPLVVGHHQRTARIDDLLDDSDVLLGDRLGHVDQDHRDLGLFQGGLSAQRGVKVGSTRLVHATADACGINEAPHSAAQVDELVHGVAGRAGDVVDDHPLGPGQPVQQAGLTDVGPTQQGHTTRPALAVARRHCRGIGQDVEHGVQHVATAPSVQRRHWPRLPQPQGPEHRGVGFGALIVDFVGHQHHGLAGSA